MVGCWSFSQTVNVCASRVTESQDRNVSEIRKARRDDAQAVWDLRNAAILAECGSHYSPAELEIWTAGEMTEDFAQAVDDYWYVATSDGRVVGTGTIALASGKVDAIFVQPDRMRTGIGRQMLRHLEKLALQAGLTELSLDATLNAAPFYRACGFVGDRVAKYESPRGIDLDCIPMTKKLRRPETGQQRTNR